MTDIRLSDLEAALATAKAQGKSKVHVHIFVLAQILAIAREHIEFAESELADLKREAVKFKLRRDRMELLGR